MPVTSVQDRDGNIIKFTEFKGKKYPYIPGIDVEANLTNLPDLKCRNDDIIIVAYPKSGTHWAWEISRMLLTGQPEVATDKRKEDSMLEFRTQEELEKLPSVRVLNTHLTPELYPDDCIQRKTKIIYVYRNPKDALVSLFHHVVKLLRYPGNWNTFFEMTMSDQIVFASWFDYTKTWDGFFQSNKEIPVLRLCYETLKQDLLGGVVQIDEFLAVKRDPAYLKTVAEKCTFSNMKQRPPQGNSSDLILRKGIIGDWKNYFTVAQNERFDEAYKTQMKGYSFEFEQFL